MLNQFTGIGKVEKKEYCYNYSEDCDMVVFTIKLCSDETQDEYIFYGASLSMIMKRNNKTDKVHEKDIVAFKGNFKDDANMLWLKSIKVV